MDAHPSHLETPALGFGPQVGQTVEIAALEEALPHVLSPRSTLGLSLGFRTRAASAMKRSSIPGSLW